MSWRGFAIAALVAGTGACSLLVSVPTDEYSNGASAGVDASIEAGGSDGRPAQGCDATFCEDFDDGPLGSKWAEQRTAGGGELSLAPSSLSPPNALRIRLTERSDTTKRSAHLARDFPFPTRARCSIDMAAGYGAPSDGDIEILSLKADESDYALYIKVQENEVGLRESLADESTTSSEITGVGWNGSWVHIVLDAEMGKQATLTVGEKTTSLGLRSITGPNLTLSIGESGDSDGWAYELLIDNLACTFTP